MAIPTPPPDNSGGYIVIQAQGGGQTHKMRFHVAPFTNDNLGTYNTIPTGAETNTGATAGNIMKALQPFYNTTWALSQVALFRVVAGVVQQYFGAAFAAAVAGTNAAAAGFAEEFYAWNFRSATGGRARFFMLGAAGWVYSTPQSYVAGNANQNQILVSYFTGGTPTGFVTKTQVVAHDGGVWLAPARVTSGVNRRVRRRVGDA